MEHPFGHRLDAEALEHPMGDLRMPLHDEPFGARQLAGLLQDLLRDRELAEVVQAAGEPRQLDLGRRQVELLGDRARDRGDALRMAAGVDVARVDGARERRRRAEAREPVADPRHDFELLGLDAAREPNLVLAVLLRPVERAVGEPDQRVALASVLRERRDAGADGDRAVLADAPFADALDDRARDLECGGLVDAGEEERELVAAEPERLAALAEPGRDLREHAVAGRVAVLVVDALEVVEVEQAHGDEPAASPRRVRARAAGAPGSCGGCRGRSAGR